MLWEPEYWSGPDRDVLTAEPTGDDLMLFDERWGRVPAPAQCVKASLCGFDRPLAALVCERTPTTKPARGPLSQTGLRMIALLVLWADDHPSEGPNACAWPVFRFAPPAPLHACLLACCSRQPASAERAM